METAEIATTIEADMPTRFIKPNRDMNVFKFVTNQSNE